MKCWYRKYLILDIEDHKESGHKAVDSYSFFDQKQVEMILERKYFIFNAEPVQKEVEDKQREMI